MSLIAERLKKFNQLTDLELFLGGNKDLNNKTAAMFVDLLEDKKKLRNFEFDVGYSKVDDEIVSMFGKHQDYIGQSLNRFGVYLNGLKVSKQSINELVDLISNCNLTEVYQEVKDIAELESADFEGFKRTLTNKIKFATVVYADESEV